MTAIVITALLALTAVALGLLAVGAIAITLLCRRYRHVDRPGEPATELRPLPRPRT